MIGDDDDEHVHCVARMRMMLLTMMIGVHDDLQKKLCTHFRLHKMSETAGKTCQLNNYARAEPLAPQ